MRNGRSRFIHHLLSQVIFPEANLAGLDRREHLRASTGPARLRRFAGAPSAIRPALGWRFLGQPRAPGAGPRAGAAMGPAAPGAWRTRRRHGGAEPLDSYAATTVFRPREVSLHERAGLYQGNGSSPPLAAAYRRELRGATAAARGADARSADRSNMQNRERLLNSLRAYLMLNLRERRENGWLKDWVATDPIPQRYAGNGTVQNKPEHTRFARLLEQPRSSYPLNETWWPRHARCCAASPWPAWSTGCCAKTGAKPARVSLRTGTWGRRPVCSSAPTT
ncbi:ImcF-related family protein [Pseudomonas aeruginosa]